MKAKPLIDLDGPPSNINFFVKSLVMVIDTMVNYMVNKERMASHKCLLIYLACM